MPIKTPKKPPDLSQQPTDEWFVYIVKCADNTLYTGIAKDVAQRIAKHNTGTGAKYTRTRTPVNEIYREHCVSRSDATKREIAIKKLSRQKKLALVGMA